MDYFTAEANRPAFYSDLQPLGLERETNTVAWMNASASVSIFAPTAESRLQWLKYSGRHAGASGRGYHAGDTSATFIRNIKADSAADYQSQTLRDIVQFWHNFEDRNMHIHWRRRISRGEAGAKTAKVNVAPEPTAEYMWSNTSSQEQTTKNRGKFYGRKHKESPPRNRTIQDKPSTRSSSQPPKP